jgi:hypothetical protein
VVVVETIATAVRLQVLTASSSFLTPTPCNRRKRVKYKKGQKSNNMPVVVFKGIEGWCDRLQVLSHCFDYCRKTNTCLCVDWDDVVWAGKRELDFYDAFQVVGGIKTMTKLQVVKMLTTIKGLKIVPSCWSVEEIVYFPPKTQDAAHEGPLMRFETPDKIDGDVIVTNGRGARRWDMNSVLAHLRVTPRMREAIKGILKDFNPYGTTLHLRGTDRPDKGYVENAIRFLTKNPRGVLNVVTDSKMLWDQIREAVPHAKLVNPNAHLLKLPERANGTHQIDPRDLEKVGCGKWDMTVDLLADWFALCFSKGAIGREESTYFSMARNLNALGEDAVETILGWKPVGIIVPPNNEAPVLPHRVQAEAGKDADTVVSSS